jgi:hypothetical protein
MKELAKIIIDATAAVDIQYFLLPIHGGDPKYRERVYCYELYHQMRLLWPEETAYYLNGEIDKAAHPVLQQLGAHRAKPDFLVHRPGYMSGNHAVIEVKARTADARGIRKDLQTLSLFTTKVGYQRAIYLVYGYEAFRATDRVKRIAEKLQGLGGIEIWAHSNPDESAAHMLTL